MEESCVKYMKAHFTKSKPQVVSKLVTEFMSEVMSYAMHKLH